MVIADGSWVDVRWYEQPDLDALRHVHEVCYPHEAWKRKDFVRFADKPGQHVYAIVKDDNEVVGSLLFNMDTETARLRRVAVLPQYRRQKIASFAVRAALIGPNSPVRRNRFTARLRERNVVGQLFVRSLDFKKTETVSAGYRTHQQVRDELGFEKEGVFEDAYWFRLDTTNEARRRRVCQEALMP